MPERIVRVTFRITTWSGWSPHHKPRTYSLNIVAREREALCAESFDPMSAGRRDLDESGYAVWPVRIWDHKAIFHYRNLVIERSDGSYSLFGPYSGDIVFRVGQHICLDTPTLDAGVHVFVRLDGIESAPPRS
jgi:hypothetical protein